MPGAIKVSVIGGHHRVLAGFGDPPRRRIGRESEAHPSVSGRMAAHLANHGLVPRRLEPMEPLDGGTVVVNVCFSQPVQAAGHFSPIWRGMFHTLTKVRDLPPYRPRESPPGSPCGNI